MNASQILNFMRSLSVAISKIASEQDNKEFANTNSAHLAFLDPMLTQKAEHEQFEIYANWIDAAFTQNFIYNSTLPVVDEMTADEYRMYLRNLIVDFKPQIDTRPNPLEQAIQARAAKIYSLSEQEILILMSRLSEAIAKTVIAQEPLFAQNSPEYKALLAITSETPDEERFEIYTNWVDVTFMKEYINKEKMPSNPSYTLGVFNIHIEINILRFEAENTTENPLAQVIDKRAKELMAIANSLRTKNEARTFGSYTGLALAASYLAWWAYDAISADPHDFKSPDPLQYTQFALAIGALIGWGNYLVPDAVEKYDHLLRRLYTCYAGNEPSVARRNHLREFSVYFYEVVGFFITPCIYLDTVPVNTHNPGTWVYASLLPLLGSIGGYTASEAINISGNLIYRSASSVANAPIWNRFKSSGRSSMSRSLLAEESDVERGEITAMSPVVNNKRDGRFMQGKS